MRKRITEAVAAALKAKAGNTDQFVFDDMLAGYFLRRTPDGVVLHKARGRCGGKRPTVTLGEWPDIKIAVARELCATALADIRAGRDPALERRARQRAASAGSVTIADFSQEWLRDTLPKLKPTTVRGYKGFLTRNVLPVVGNLTVAGMTEADCVALHLHWQSTPRAANCALNVLGYILAHAVSRGFRTDNPTSRVKRFREPPRERFLDKREQALAFEAVDESAGAGEITMHAAAGIKLALLTGARRSEICATRWGDIDWERKLIRLADSKTNAPRTIFLNEMAIDILRSIPRVGTYVIAGGRNGAPYQALSQSWIIARKRRGLDDTRLHDLRHSYASAALAAGLPLASVGRLLGHKRASATERYAHLSAEHVQAAGDVVGAALAAAITKPTASGAVVKLQRRKQGRR